MPDYVPLWAVVLFGYGFFPAITFAALRFGETGMDIAKSLRPLILSLNPSSGNTLVKLRQKRAALAAEVTDAINTLGPEMFPDFDAARIVADPFLGESPSTPTTPTHRRSRSRSNSDGFNLEDEQSPTLGHSRSGTADASIGGGSGASNHQLPRNDSFKYL
ncbi:Glycerol-3-phosphate/dihydroxyacetone phosphate acyltransferase, partial [Cryomyces antarcticus]